VIGFIDSRLVEYYVQIHIIPMTGSFVEEISPRRKESIEGIPVRVQLPQGQTQPLREQVIQSLIFPKSRRRSATHTFWEKPIVRIAQ
jgi:hypothetical protein